MAGLYGTDYVETLRQGVARAIGDWGFSPHAEVALITVSENATFRVSEPAGGRTGVFRVYRQGYHSRAEILSELAWIEAVRNDAVVRTPALLQRRDGQRLGVLPDGREVAAFAHAPGQEPRPDEPLEPAFHALGAITARLHAHARRWQPPAGFQRKRWDWDTCVGPRAHWGDWRNALGLSPEGTALLGRTAEALRHRLGIYGTAAARFGLIHADLRLANLLVDGTTLTVIDFDDCGFGWHGFDFAAAISFFETDPQIPALEAAWLEGYRTVAELAPEDAAMLPVFVMLRRLQLTAWIASHRETPTASELGADYTTGTLTLAERFLAAPSGRSRSGSGVSSAPARG
ncbi:MAG: phosphotransferase enzyme family protein [Pikeienuella sp.]